MREIRTSGLMSGEGKRGLRQRLKNPRLSSTLQIKGRKRHILVDTMGLLLSVVVHPAIATGETTVSIHRTHVD